MIRGLYTAAAGMMSVQIANDTMAANMANVDTAGYKSSRATYQSFKELLLTRMGQDGAERIGSLSTGSKIYGTPLNMNNGSMKETGNGLDAAIHGEGFFTIQTPDKRTYYTRAGNFAIDEEGYLTTVNGDYVMGELGRINFRHDQESGKLTKDPFTLHSNGEIHIGNRFLDRLLIARFENPQMLDRVGDTGFMPNDNTAMMPQRQREDDDAFKVVQGSLEQSNCNVVGELVNTITGMRLYEALQKNIHMQNQSLEKAVNEVGRNR